MQKHMGVERQMNIQTVKYTSMNENNHADATVPWIPSTNKFITSTNMETFQ